MAQQALSTQTPLPSPASIRGEFPLNAASALFIDDSRSVIRRILEGTDKRLLVIAGPCSVHDYESALDYADFIREQNRLYADTLYIAMRCYIEKSRTAVGWKGMARDPFFNEGTGTTEGIRLSRKLIVNSAAKEVPVAVEIVSPFLWPYWIDAVSWASIGARGVESQALREAAAALPCPCGFKNGRDGEPDAALFAIASAREASKVLIHDDRGGVSEIQVPGNPLPHIVLRGGTRGPNWKIAPALEKRMRRSGLVPAIVIDASHANSGRNPDNQTKTAQAACRMRAKKISVRGIMLESYLEGGAQQLVSGTVPRPRLSVTDSCIDLAETRRIFGYLSEHAFMD